VGVTGGAGAGKTTLLLCAAGLLRPDRGNVAWLGSPASDDRSTGGPAPWYHSLRGAFRLQDVERALASGARLLLLDHAAPVSLLEDRGALGRALAHHAAALVIASHDRLTLARMASRILAIRDGRVQVIDRLGAPRAEYQRKRSAARASSELPSALARSRIRSTCGRSFRSPQ
jgi:ATPase subunit of ABC transporter with duplicated ATPase domains